MNCSYFAIERRRTFKVNKKIKQKQKNTASKQANQNKRKRKYKHELANKTRHTLNKLL